jgi:hypothetical protein
MIESDQGPAPAGGGDFVWSDADPGDEAIDATGCRFGTDAAYANNRVEIPGANAAHTVVNAEPAVSVWVASMRPLVNEYAHTVVPRGEALRHTSRQVERSPIDKASGFVEVVAIDSLDRVAPPRRDANVVLEHQLSQTTPVDENDSDADALRVIHSLGGE